MASTGAAIHRGGRLVRSSKLSDSPVTSGLRQSSGTANSRQNPACASSMTTLCPGRAPKSNQAMFAASRVPRLAIWNRRGSSWRLRRRIMEPPAKDSAPGSQAGSAMIPRTEEARNWPGRARAVCRPGRCRGSGPGSPRPGRGAGNGKARGGRQHDGGAAHGGPSLTAAAGQSRRGCHASGRSGWANDAWRPPTTFLAQLRDAAGSRAWAGLHSHAAGTSLQPARRLRRSGQIRQRPAPTVRRRHNHNFVCVRYLMSLYL